MVLENIIPGGRWWGGSQKLKFVKVHCMNQNGILGWLGEFGQNIVVGIWIFSKQFYVTI